MNTVVLRIKGNHGTIPVYRFRHDGRELLVYGSSGHQPAFLGGAGQGDLVALTEQLEQAVEAKPVLEEPDPEQHQSDLFTATPDGVRA